MKIRMYKSTDSTICSSDKSDWSAMNGGDIEKGVQQQSSTTKMMTTSTTANYTPNQSQNISIEKGEQVSPLPDQLISKNSQFHLYAHKWVFTSLIVILGTAAAAVVLMIGMLSAQRETAAEFDHEASELAHAIDLSWQNYIMFSLWVHESCHFHSVADHDDDAIDKSNHESSSIASKRGFCSRHKFKHLYEHIQSMQKKFVAIQYIPNITNDLRPQLEKESRLFLQQHDPNFTYGGIRDYLAYPNATFKGIVPSPADRSWYFPIHYLEPLEHNEVAMDLDMYSFRKDEIDKAMKTWQPVLGPRGKLLQDNHDDVYAVSLIHPGYPSSLDEDLKPSQAISKIVIRVPDLIYQAAENAAFGCSVVYIFDETEHRMEQTNNGEPIFLAGADVSVDTGSHNRTRLKPEIAYKDIPRAGRQMFSTTIRAADHTWRIVIYPKMGMPYTQNPSYPFIILGGCIILVGCLLLAVAFHCNIRRVAKMNKIKSDSEQEKAELALMQAKREMHLNDFIAHEVRNPLSSAIAALSFVTATTQEQLDDNSETKRLLLEDVHIIDSSLQYINDLLRNMLDIHRTQSKKMKLDSVPTDILKDIFEPVVAILFMKQNKAKIITECPDNLVVTLDRLRVKQIVLNLAINSSKFVDDGFIRLRAQVVDGGTGFQLFIEDSGPGIPLEKRGRLFAKFQESFDLLSQGTGIGLHICKHLSDLMGADLYLDENYHSGLEGRPGARFVVHFNTPPMSTSMMTDKAGMVLDDDSINERREVLSTMTDNLFLRQDLPEDPLTILFVDDDLVLRKLFSRTLRRLAPHWHVEEASNGETAVKLAQSNMYHIIFIDQYMASIEKQLLGTETVRALRAKGINSILCGLSANDLKQQFLDSGADAFMHKPFPCEKEKLAIEIRRVLHEGKRNNHGGLPSSYSRIRQ